MTNHLLGSYFQVKSFLRDSSIDVTPMWHAIKIIKETKKNSIFKTCLYNFHFLLFSPLFFSFKRYIEHFCYLPSIGVWGSGLFAKTIST